MIKNEKKRNEKTAQSSGKIREKNCEKNNGKGLLIRIRSYTTFDGKKIYSKWSAPIKIK